jgi:hypothetical protein
MRDVVAALELVACGNEDRRVLFENVLHAEHQPHLLEALEGDLLVIGDKGRNQMAFVVGLPTGRLVAGRQILRQRHGPGALCTCAGQQMRPAQDHATVFSADDRLACRVDDGADLVRRSHGYGPDYGPRGRVCAALSLEMPVH